jgi:hypothetical protein
MKMRLVLLGTAALLATAAISARQPAAEDERRAAITLLRAINTAEAAVNRTGHYVALPELIEHGAMARVKPDIVVSGAAVTYHSAQVRLALSADAKQYVVTVVTGAPNYTAAFSDERGVIYTGKALE